MLRRGVDVDARATQARAARPVEVANLTVRAGQHALRAVQGRPVVPILAVKLAADVHRRHKRLDCPCKLGDEELDVVVHGVADSELEVRHAVVLGVRTNWLSCCQRIDAIVMCHRGRDRERRRRAEAIHSQVESARKAAIAPMRIIRLHRHNIVVQGVGNPSVLALAHGRAMHRGTDEEVGIAGQRCKLEGDGHPRPQQVEQEVRVLALRYDVCTRHALDQMLDAFRACSHNRVLRLIIPIHGNVKPARSPRREVLRTVLQHDGIALVDEDYVFATGRQRRVVVVGAAWRITVDRNVNIRITEQRGHADFYGLLVRRHVKEVAVDASRVDPAHLRNAVDQWRRRARVVARHNGERGVAVVSEDPNVVVARWSAGVRVVGHDVDDVEPEAICRPMVVSRRRRRVRIGVNEHVRVTGDGRQRDGHGVAECAVVVHKVRPLVGANTAPQCDAILENNLRIGRGGDQAVCAVSVPVHGDADVANSLRAATGLPPFLVLD
mmetsp:Transcript_10055/g.35225  ORF Transcript_10055/g.35225 Transcript_10055/m.35225 type:complete len:495 (-) Transcript_10055:413-1897(-)